MNILYINTLYDGGGAEKVCQQFFQEMGKLGHTVYCIVGNNTRKLFPEEKNIQVIYHNIFLRILNRIMTYNHNFASLSIPYTRFFLIHFLKKHKIDIIHIHNGHGNYIGIQDISILAKDYPMIWTIHDFWLVTGHCVSPNTCKQWESGCQDCQLTDIYTPVKSRKKIKKLYQKKKEKFCNKNIIFVTPSDFVRQRIKKSYLERETILCIPNGIKINQFIAYDKQKIRERLGLPKDKIVLAAIAAQMSIKQKGIDRLLEAVRRLEDKEKYFVIFAGSQFIYGEELKQIGVEYRDFGYQHSVEELSEFYSAADILVNPSQEETFGLVNIEAMACGTPVIAFDICAMKEIILPHVGWIVEENSAQGLSEMITRVGQNKMLIEEKTKHCRQYVAEKYNIEVIISQYENLYYTCMDRWYTGIFQKDMLE